MREIQHTAMIRRTSTPRLWDRQPGKWLGMARASAIGLAGLLLSSGYPLFASVDQPLTRAEKTKALNLAQVVLPNLRFNAEHADENHSNPLTGHQVLLVQLKETKRKGDTKMERLAEVFTYDYQTLTTDYHLVNLDTESLVQSQSLDQHHLPLNERETEYAMAVLKSNQALMATIKTEYYQLYREPLLDLDQLSIKAVIKIPALKNNRCSNERCAQLSIVTRDLISLTIEPIIVLREGKLLGLVDD